MKNDKKITNTAKLIIIFLEAGMFALVWNLDYNDYAFRTHRDLGSAGACFVWVFIYCWMCALFGAFSIASSYIGDIVISQIICIGIPDLVLFLSGCLLVRSWVSLWSGIMCAICQIVIVCIAVTITKQILMKRMIPDKTIVVYGDGYSRESAKFFAERLLEKYSHMFEIVEIIDAGADEVREKIDENDRIVMAGINYENRKELAKYCIDTGKIFYFIPEIEEIIFQNCNTKNLLDTPLKRFDFINNKKSYQILKRAIDLILAIVLLIIASPFMFITAAAIKLEDGGPVLFRQLRVTKDEKTFYILKFRSMVTDADKHGVIPTTGKDPRITRVGSVIRPLRIDELPQLFNIIKGDMAFVGPRPERIEHVQKYEADLPEFKYRHMVKGGLTGYAQVYGKYNTSPEDKLKLDLIYIMNQGLYMDFRLFLLTVRTVFQKESTEGFSKEQSKEMNEFQTAK